MGASRTAEGWAALQVGDGQNARAAFTEELATCDSGEVWEGLSAASFVLLEYPRAIEDGDSPARSGGRCDDALDAWKSW